MPSAASLARSARAQCSAFADMLRWRAYNLVPFNGPRRWYLQRVYHARLGAQTYVHSPLRVVGHHVCTNRFEIGANTTVNFGCFLDLRDSVVIGQNTMIGHCSKIYTASHDYQAPTFDFATAPVTIGDHVVVFPNCLVMPGSTVADGCVLLPGAVFSGSSEPWTVYGGVPAKAIGPRNPEVAYRHRYRVWFAQA